MSGQIENKTAEKYFSGGKRNEKEKTASPAAVISGSAFWAVSESGKSEPGV